MGNRPLIISHRGRCAGARLDNTLDAFRSAIACGSDGIEMDVRRTADGKLIVFHDRKVARKKVKRLTHSAILRLVEYEIPLLEDVLKLAANSAFAAIELKESGYEGKILEEVSRHLGFDEFIIISFLPRVLRAVKRLEPRVRTGLLFHSRLRLRAKMKFCMPDCALPLVKLLKKPLQKDCKSVIAWGVNDETQITLACGLGLRGIITDFPEKALELLR